MQLIFSIIEDNVVLVDILVHGYRITGVWIIYTKIQKIQKCVFFQCADIELQWDLWTIGQLDHRHCTNVLQYQAIWQNGRTTMSQYGKVHIKIHLRFWVRYLFIRIIIIITNSHWIVMRDQG